MSSINKRKVYTVDDGIQIKQKQYHYMHSID